MLVAAHRQVVAHRHLNNYDRLNARVSLETDEVLKTARATNGYRNLTPVQRHVFTEAIEQEMAGAHASISGRESPGEKISAARKHFRDKLNDQGELIRRAYQKASAAH